MTDKKTLRRFFIAARKALADDERRAADRSICDAVRALKCYRDAKCVALYATDGFEPDLLPLFGEKRCFFPRFNAAHGVYELVEIDDPVKGLVTARYGLREPAPELPAADADFVRENMLFLTPAAACTRRGARLGRGGGFYDRLLAGRRGAAVGVIYPCQLADDLPEEPHDHRLDFVVAGGVVWDCRRDENDGDGARRVASGVAEVGEKLN
ncbi:MAG: 5-formyltetrahydrofolate cyclo-ligase [Victivallaceae bacterium]|nr:5-formyltetrahydrofolate cyclo-ligase [Victivallaceae bacterium]